MQFSIWEMFLLSKIVSLPVNRVDLEMAESLVSVWGVLEVTPGWNEISLN